MHGVSLSLLADPCSHGMSVEPLVASCLEVLGFILFAFFLSLALATMLSLVRKALRLLLPLLKALPSARGELLVLVLSLF